MRLRSHGHLGHWFVVGMAALHLVAAHAGAGSLIGSFAPVAAGSNVNLTVLGPVDWVHWGLHTDSSITRKQGVAPLIGNFSLVGDLANNFLAAYQYTDNANGYTWLDGAPTASVTNTTTGVWAYQASMAGSFPVGSGFQLTVPADNSTRTLKVYVGAFAAKGRFEASLSDQSAPDFVSGNAPGSTVDNVSYGPGGVFSIAYSADSPGQELVIRWTVAAAYNVLQAPNVTLQAATLTAPGANNPPFAVLTSPASFAAFAGPASIALSASAQDFDGTVTNVTFYAGATSLGQKAMSPYNLIWNNAATGRYLLSATATDNAGRSRASTPVEVFVYGTGGAQSGSVGFPGAATDLTTEGTADWAHWGLLDTDSFNYKSHVARQIHNFTRLGTNPVERFTDNYTSFTWSDGTPTPTTTGTTTGVFVGGRTNGFQLTMPADTVPRTLRVYVGGYGSQGIFQACLSDLSAPPFTDTSVSNVFGNSYAVYVIDYAAASAGQSLIVTYRALEAFDVGYGNVTLQAATLQGGPQYPSPVFILNPQRVGFDFICSFATVLNRTYFFQYTDSLSPIAWQTVGSFSGNGETITATNYNIPQSQRFYRVETQ